MLALYKSVAFRVCRENKSQLYFRRKDIQESFLGFVHHCSTSNPPKDKSIDKMVEFGIKEDKSSKAMRAYLERSQAYNKFMEKEREEFRTGKRHLANMMGSDPETFSQQEIDEAIAYLLPSGLFVKKTRPFLKPPEEVYPPKKEAEFDESGRPFHYLFYTGKPNFYAFLHKLVDVLKELNDFEDAMIRKQLKPDPKLMLQTEGYEWLSTDQFKEKFLEDFSKHEATQLIHTLDRIVAHPYSYRAIDIITECRKAVSIKSQTELIPKPELEADGRESVTFTDSKRKTARANVTLRSPGTGLFTVNGQDLTYFIDLQVREQILFPLHLTGKLNDVDIECSVQGGGPSGQSGAIRYGISMALRSFVPPKMREKMRIAGLLTRDRRRKERKKPGQEGARRKFTWKKR